MTSTRSKGKREDLAALQAHWSRGLQLSSHSYPKPKRKRKPRPSKKPPQRTKELLLVPHDEAWAAATLPPTSRTPQDVHHVVVDAGRHLHRKEIVRGDDTLVHKPFMTLAQRYGLVEAPLQPLSRDAWARVLQIAHERGDARGSCPICQDHFGVLPQLLLSCSHVFHKSCLESFERYSKHRVCPMCRSENYQKLEIGEGARETMYRAAVTIQSVVRGWLERKRFAHQLSTTVLAPSSHLRHVAAKARLGVASDAVMESVLESNKEVDALFGDLDATAAVTDQIFDAWMEHLALRTDDHKAVHVENGDVRVGGTTSTQEWKQVASSALQRDQRQCAICLVDFASSKKPIMLLSCTHVFHATCIASLELFDPTAERLCPVCRQPYERKTWENKVKKKVKKKKKKEWQ